MKSKLFFLLVTMIAAMTFTACSSDDDDTVETPSTPETTDPDNPQEKEEDYKESGLLDSISKSEVYTPEQFAQALANSPIFTSYKDQMGDFYRVMEPVFKLQVNARVPKMDALFEQEVGKSKSGQPQWAVESYVFSYKTTTPEGNDTTFVGRVTFPNNTVEGVNHEVTSITLHSHQATYDIAWLPSKSPSMMTLHSLHNSVVVEPDFYEIDGTLMQVIRAYINGDNLAKMAYDCIEAALDIMHQHGVHLSADAYMNNWGSSLGMPATMGVCTYYEDKASEGLKKKIRLNETFAGEGITQVSQVHMYTEDARSNTPFRQSSLSGSYTYLSTWEPKYPVYLACSPNDNFVSYDELKKYYEELRLNADGTINQLVHWIDVPVVKSSMSPKVGGTHFVAATLVLLYMSLAEDPHDMVELMKSAE